MVQNDHFTNITLERISTIYDTYVLLANLIERYPSEALKFGYFQLLVIFIISYQGGGGVRLNRGKIVYC